MKKNYNVTSDGRSKVYYEDLLCRVTLVVADFRDSSWGISLETTVDKRNGNIIKLSKEQRYELFRRISADSKTELYTTEFKFIKEELSNIDGNVSILDFVE